MKPELIDQLEKELTWIFIHVPWANPAARRKEIQRTIAYLAERRAQGGGGAQQAKEAGLACSRCGKELPLASTAKRRFCSPKCKQSYFRKQKRQGVLSGVSNS